MLADFDLENVFVATSAAIDSAVDFSRMIVYLLTTPARFVNQLVR